MAQTFSGVTEAEAAIKACEALGFGRSQLRYQVVTRDEIDRRVVIEVDEHATAAAKAEDRRPPRRDDRSDGPRRDSRGGGDRGRPRGGDRGRGSRPRREDDEFSDTLAEEYKEFREMTAAPKTPVEPKPALDEAALSERAMKALDVTRQLLALGNFSARAQVSVDKEDQVLVDIHGADEGLIIGRKGETLLALQFMVNRFVGRESEGPEKVAVDCEGYRARRQEALRVLALKLGEKVRQEGKPFTLSPMNAHDRRIFHVTLDGAAGLRTQSEGEGLMRRVMIIPA
jgi:spoIIIJ-associated protein